MNTRNTQTRTPWYHRLTAFVLALVMTFSLTSGWLTLPVSAIKPGVNAGEWVDKGTLKVNEDGTWSWQLQVKPSTNSDYNGSNLSKWSLVVGVDIPAKSATTKVSLSNAIEKGLIGTKTLTADMMETSVAKLKLPMSLFSISGGSDDKSTDKNGKITFTGTLPSLEEMKTILTEQGIYPEDGKIKFHAILVSTGGDIGYVEQSTTLQETLRATLTANPNPVTATYSTGGTFTTDVTCNVADAILLAQDGKSVVLTKLTDGSGKDILVDQGLEVSLSKDEEKWQKGEKRTVTFTNKSLNNGDGPFAGQAVIYYNDGVDDGHKCVIDFVIQAKDATYMQANPLTIRVTKGDVTGKSGNAVVDVVIGDQENSPYVYANLKSQLGLTGNELWEFDGVQFPDGDTLEADGTDTSDVTTGYIKNSTEFSAGQASVRIKLVGDSWNDKEPGIYDLSGNEIVEDETYDETSVTLAYWKGFFKYTKKTKKWSAVGEDKTIKIPIRVIIEEPKGPKLAVDGASLVSWTDFDDLSSQDIILKEVNGIEATNLQVALDANTDKFTTQLTSLDPEVVDGKSYQRWKLTVTPEAGKISKGDSFSAGISVSYTDSTTGETAADSPLTGMKAMVLIPGEGTITINLNGIATENVVSEILLEADNGQQIKLDMTKGTGGKYPYSVDDMVQPTYTVYVDNIKTTATVTADNPNATVDFVTVKMGTFGEGVDSASFDYTLGDGSELNVSNKKKTTVSTAGGSVNVLTSVKTAPKLSLTVTAKDDTTNNKKYAPDAWGVRGGGSESNDVTSKMTRTSTFAVDIGHNGEITLTPKAKLDSIGVEVLTLLHTATKGGLTSHVWLENASDESDAIEGKDDNDGKWQFANVKPGVTYQIKVSYGGNAVLTGKTITIADDGTVTSAPDNKIHWVTVKVEKNVTGGTGEFKGSNAGKESSGVNILTDISGVNIDTVEIDATPTPNSNYTFKSWSGDDVGSFVTLGILATGPAHTKYRPNAGEHSGPITLTPVFDETKFGGTITVMLNGQNLTGTDPATTVQLSSDGVTFIDATTSGNGVWEYVGADKTKNYTVYVNGVANKTLGTVTNQTVSQTSTDATVNFITVTMGDANPAGSGNGDFYPDNNYTTAKNETKVTVLTSVDAPQELYIKAEETAPYKFTSWSADKGGTFADSMKASTTYTPEPNSSSAVTLTPNFGNYKITVTTYVDTQKTADKNTVSEVRVWNEDYNDYVDLDWDSANCVWSATTEKTCNFTYVGITTDTGAYSHVRLRGTTDSNVVTINGGSPTGEVDLWTVTANTQTYWSSGTFHPTGGTTPTHKVALGTKTAKNDTTTGVVPNGKQVTLTATADTNGYRFSGETFNLGWTSDVDNGYKGATETATSHVIEKKTTFTANFEPIPVTWGTPSGYEFTYGVKETLNLSERATADFHGATVVKYSVDTTGLDSWVVKTLTNNNSTSMPSLTDAQPNVIHTEAFNLKVTAYSSNGTSKEVEIPITVKKLTVGVKLTGRGTPYYENESVPGSVVSKVELTGTQGTWYYDGDLSLDYDSTKWRQLDYTTDGLSVNYNINKLTSGENTIVATLDGTKKPNNASNTLSEVWDIETGNLRVTTESAVPVTITVYKDATSDTDTDTAKQYSIYDTKEIVLTRTTDSKQFKVNFSGAVASFEAVPNGTYSVTIDGNALNPAKKIIVGSTEVKERIDFYTVKLAQGDHGTMSGSSVTGTEASTNGTAGGEINGIWLKGSTVKTTVNSADGYRFDKWVAQNTTTAQNNNTSTTVNWTVESTIDVVATYTANTVTIKTNLNGVSDTTNDRAITLYSESSGTWVTTTHTAQTSTSGQVKFTAVPNGTYRINDTTGWTGLTIEVDNNDPEKTIQYYAVKFATTVDNGKYTAGSAPVATEVISNGTEGTRDSVTLPGVTADTNYKFKEWTQDPSAGKIDPNTATGDTWTVTRDYNTDIHEKGGITLTPTFDKKGATLRVNISKDGTATDGLTVTTTVGTDTKSLTQPTGGNTGDYQITELPAGDYTISVSDGTTTWVIDDSAKFTINDKLDDKLDGKLEFFTVKVQTDNTPTSKDVLINKEATFAGVTTTEMIFIKDFTSANFSSKAEDGYGGTVTWKIYDVDASGSKTGNGAALNEGVTKWKVTKTAIAEPTYTANVIEIAVFKNGDPETTAKNIYLYPDNDSSKKLTGNYNTTTGIVTFNTVPELESGKVYNIYDVVGSTETDTGLTVSVISGDTEDTKKLYYYDVIFQDLVKTTDNGVYGTDINSSASTPASVEILINGSEARRTVNMPQTTPDDNYSRAAWSIDPTGAGNAPSATIGSASGQTWAPSSDFTEKVEKGIKLKPKFERAGSSLTVIVQKDGANVAEDTEVTLDSETTKEVYIDSTDGKSKVKFDNLTSGDHYVTASAIGYGKLKKDVAANTDVVVTMNFYTVTTKQGTGAAWAWVTNSSSAPTTPTTPTLTNSAVFLEATPTTNTENITNSENTAYLHSAASSGYTGSATWEVALTAGTGTTNSSESGGVLTVRDTVTATASYIKLISNVEVTNIPVPEIGKKPASETTTDGNESFTKADLPSDADYVDTTTGESGATEATIKWSVTDGADLTSDDEFEYGKSYTATVTVKPKDESCKFADMVSTSANKLGGADSDKQTADKAPSDGTVTVAYIFPAVYKLVYDLNDATTGTAPDGQDFYESTTGIEIASDNSTSWTKNGYSGSIGWAYKKNKDGKSADLTFGTKVDGTTLKSHATDGVVTLYYVWTNGSMTVGAQNLVGVYNMSQSEWTSAADSTSPSAYQGRKYTGLVVPTTINVTAVTGTVDYANLTYEIVDSADFTASDYFEFTYTGSNSTRRATLKLKDSAKLPAVKDGGYTFKVKVTPTVGDAVEGNVTLTVRPIELDHAALSDLNYNGTTNTTLDETVTKTDTQTTDWQGFYKDNTHQATDAAIDVEWSGVSAYAAATEGGVYTATITLKPKDSNYVFVEYSPNGTLQASDKANGWYVGTQKATTTATGTDWKYELKDETGSGTEQYNTVVLTKTFNPADISVGATLTATAYNKLKVSNFVATTVSNVKLYYLIYDTDKSSNFNGADGQLDASKIQTAYNTIAGGTADANCIANGVSGVITPSGTTAQMADFDVTTNVNSDTRYYLYVFAEVVKSDGTAADPAKLAAYKDEDPTPKKLTLTHNGYGSVSWTVDANIADSNTDTTGKTLPADSTLTTSHSATDVVKNTVISMFQDDTFTATPANTTQFGFAKWTLKKSNEGTANDISGLNPENEYKYNETTETTNTNDETLHAIFYRKINGSFTIPDPTESTAKTYKPYYDNTVFIGALTQGKYDVKNSDTSTNKLPADSTTASTTGIKYQWYWSNNKDQDEKVDTGWTEITGATSLEWENSTNAYPGATFRLKITYKDPDNGGAESFIAAKTGVQVTPLPAPTPVLSKVESTVNHPTEEAHFYLSDTDKTNGTNEIDKDEGGLHLTFPKIAQESENAVDKYKITLSYNETGKTDVVDTVYIDANGSANYYYWWEAGLSGDHKVVPGYNYQVQIEAIAKANNGKYSDTATPATDDDPAGYKTWRPSALVDKTFNGAAQDGHSGWSLPTTGFGVLTVEYENVRSDSNTAETTKTHVNITTATGDQTETKPEYDVYLTLKPLEKGQALYLGFERFNFTTTAIQPNTYLTDQKKKVDADKRDWKITQATPTLSMTTVSKAVRESQTLTPKMTYTTGATDCWNNASGDTAGDITRYYDYTFSFAYKDGSTATAGTDYTFDSSTGEFIALKSGTFTVTVTANYKDSTTDQFKADIATASNSFEITIGNSSITGIKLERFEAVNGAAGNADDTDDADGKLNKSETRTVIYATSVGTEYDDLRGDYNATTATSSKEMLLKGLRLTVTYNTGATDVYIFGDNTYESNMARSANTWDGYSLPTGFEWVVSGTDASIDSTTKGTKLTFTKAGTVNISVKYKDETIQPTNAVTYTMTPKTLTATVTGDNKIWDGSSDALNCYGEDGKETTNSTKIALDKEQTFATDADGNKGADDVTVTATAFDYYNGDNKVSDVGNNYTVKATGAALSGAQAGFYKLGTVTDNSGNITPRAIPEVTINTPKLYGGMTPADANDSADLTVTAKDSLGNTNVLVDYSANYKNDKHIKWQKWNTATSAWEDFGNGEKFTSGSQYRPVVEVKADKNHYLVKVETDTKYTIDGNKNGEPTTEAIEAKRAEITTKDTEPVTANNEGTFKGAAKSVGAVRPELKFKDNYDGGTREFEKDYRQIITVTVGEPLKDYDFNVFLGDFIADAANVKVDFEDVKTAGVTNMKDMVTLNPEVPTNIGGMTKDFVNNDGNGYALTLPTSITNAAGQYELSLKATGTSTDEQTEIDTAHYHLIIVVKEKTGDGNGGAEPQLKFSDSYNNGNTIDPNYQQSYTRVISLVEGDNINDTDYLVSLKDFAVNAENVTLKLVENTVGATVTDKTTDAALTAAGMSIGNLNVNDTRELNVTLPSTLSKGNYLLHITADGKNNAGNAGSTAHYYLVITVAEKKTNTIQVPGGTTTITTTVEVPVETPVVTYWISEKGVTNDLTAEKMGKVGDHPSFTPKVSGLDGYEFIGWSETDPTTLKSGETVTLVDPLTFEITEDKTFYACYERSGNGHKNYVIGYPDGTFRPDAPITRAEVATIVARSCLDGFVEGYDYGNPGNYTDVNLKGWYASAVAYCTMMGVFEGYKDGTFRPSQYITREELATVVARLAGIRTNNGIPFADAAEVSKWARDGVYTCYAYGYINGYSDGTFRPQNDITRAETVKIFNGYLNRGVDATGLSGLTPFVLSGTASRGELDNGHQYLTWEDVPAKHWAYYEIIEASNTHDYHWPTKVENPPEDWDAAYIQEEWLARAHYIITWMAGEGIASAATTRAKLNAIPVAPSVTPPEGQILLGWAIEPEGEIVDLTTYTITGATTFYAVYGEKPVEQYAVRYELGLHGSAEGDLGETVKAGEYPVAVPVVTAEEDYIFVGWANKEGYIVDVTSCVVTGDTTFYAIYAEKEKIYTVYYVTNENGTLSGATEEQVKAGSSPVAPPTATPAEGYKFDGWALREEGEIVNVAVYAVTSDTTLHAVYGEQKYTVRYETNPNGTLSGATEEQVRGGKSPIAVPTVTPADGYSFKGWALSENGTVVNVASYAVKANTVFYAVYAKKNAVYTHTAFADGYADGSFHANEEITRAAVADMLARIHSDYDPNHAYSVSQFTDLTGDYWAANAIGYCVENGLFTGTTVSTFEPERTMTRQEFSVVIARMAGIQTNQGLPFTDASNVSKWARDAVYTVYVNGWITGYKDGTFLPKKTITRAEAVKIICGFLGRSVTRDSIGEDLSVTTWSDVPRKSWAYAYIMEATNTHTYYVDANGNEVWVSGTSGGNTLEVPTQNTKNDEVLYTGYVNATSGLNARSAPEIGNNVLQVLAGNTQVEVLELINDWCRIRYRSASGATAEAYVKTQYITRDL